MAVLDVKNDRIVENAVLVTDSNLNVVDEAGFDIVIHQPGAVLACVCDVVQAIHGSPG